MTCRSWTPARRGPGTAQKPVSSTRGMRSSSGNSSGHASAGCQEPIRRAALIRIGRCCISVPVNRLIDYLRKHLMIDFQGDLTVGMVRELLAGDDSRDAKALLAKLVADKKVEDMMLVLADCLLEAVQTSLTDDLMREQIRMYSES